jgi:hypothetical protein
MIIILKVQIYLHQINSGIQMFFLKVIKTYRGALFEVIRKVACAQISNMRMVL